MHTQHTQTQTHTHLIERMAVSVSRVIMPVMSQGQAECTLPRYPEVLRPTDRVTAGSWGESTAVGFRVSF